MFSNDSHSPNRDFVFNNVGELMCFLYADSRAEFPRLQSFYVPA